MNGKDTLTPAVRSFNEESVLRFTAYTQAILIYYMKNICAAKIGCMCPFFRNGIRKGKLDKVSLLTFKRKLHCFPI